MKPAELELVWKALADPTRREILDLLKDQPLSTGQLCVPFELSRFAIMKHLAILEKAGLVVVRRVGRERFNHLNAVPIRQIYERWVRSYEGQWASNLLDLKSQIEEGKDKAMTVNLANTAAFGVAQVELEIPIMAKPARVWEALVKETSRWWLKDFHTSPSTKRFVIDARIGGHAYEDSGDGTGQIWYTVMGVQAQESVMLHGLLTPAFGGPAQSILQLTLKSSGKGTILQLSDTIYGKVGPEKKEQTSEGWRMLFEDGLRKFVEAS